MWKNHIIIMYCRTPTIEFGRNLGIGWNTRITWLRSTWPTNWIYATSMKYVATTKKFHSKLFNAFLCDCCKLFQELALYGEFTLRETLLYFGWIAGMATSDVDEKIDFLIRLLQLPSVTRFVKSLSGGQQRRMSLAAALLHGNIEP